MSEETLTAAPETAATAPAKEATLSPAKTTVVKKATPKLAPAPPKVAPAPKGLKAPGPAKTGRPVGSKGTAPKAPTPAKLPASMKEIAERFRPASALVKIISDPTRLGMLVFIAGERLNVGELCVKMGAKSQPAVSHHLALMRAHGIVESDRDGKHNYYLITDKGQRLVDLFELIEEHEKKD